MSSPHTEWTLVSPELAAEWLINNNCNRPFRSRLAKRYASDMAHGYWKKTGEPIIFDFTGCLLNGQHRLNAVILSGRTVEMLVIRGIERSAAVAIDDGAKRTLVDVAAFAGVSDITRPIAGYARMAYTGLTKANQSTKTVMLRFISQHLDALVFACDVLSPRVNGISVAPVGGAFTAAYYHMDHDQLRRAGHILLDGAPTGDTIQPGDRSIMRLQRALLLMERRYGFAGQHEKYGKTIRALMAYTAGEDLARIYCPLDDPWAIPHDEDDA